MTSEELDDKISAWHAAKPCLPDAHIRDYSWQRDAHFCTKCSEWLEQACSDPNCSFCAGREPKVPLHEYLGWTWETYRAWMERQDTPLG